MTRPPSRSRAANDARRRAGRPPHQRPAQAASRMPRTGCDSRRRETDDSHEPLSDNPGAIQCSITSGGVTRRWG